jgi:hypothetical protein
MRHAPRVVAMINGRNDGKERAELRNANTRNMGILDARRLTHVTSTHLLEARALALVCPQAVYVGL